MTRTIRLATAAAVIAALLSVTPGAVEPADAAFVGFAQTELLGKPTATSMTVNVVPSRSVTLRAQYGTSSGVYTGTTGMVSAGRHRGAEVTMTGLTPNTRYYYRIQYDSGDGVWESRDEHTFTTQRFRGSSYSFVLQSDSHLQGGPETSTALYANTVANMVADAPDFLIDLGDMFEVTGSAGATRLDARSQRNFLEPLSADSAVYLAIGNHENEEGWWRTGSSPSTPIWNVNARKEFFANPVPDGFYTGDSTDHSALGVEGDGLRETYYAWEWGDALFVVLDPFWNTVNRPHSNEAGEDPVDTEVSGDRWDWTLGLEQYNWLFETLSTSTAPYKFVFTHHLVGGSTVYGRGGRTAVNAGFEWAANDSVFATNRPGWAHGSIHSMLQDYNVQTVFHGHDHCFATETVDGIVYQEVPMPNDAGLTTTFCGGYTGVLENSGHVRVDVTPSLATVSYIRSTLDPLTNAIPEGVYTLDPIVVNNSPPTADAGSDITATDLDGNGVESVTFDGSGSTDPEGAISAYRWLDGGSQLATGISPTLELALGTRTITLEVTDIYGVTDTDTVMVTVARPPSADAGPDQTVVDANDNGIQRVTLDATGSSSPNGAIVSYVWTENGEQIATGSGPNVNLGLGVHDIVLTVTDSVGASDTDSFTATVLSPPLVPADGLRMVVQARYGNHVGLHGFPTGAVTVEFERPGGQACGDFATGATGGVPGCDVQPGWTAVATGGTGSTEVDIVDLAITAFDIAGDRVTVSVDDPTGSMAFGCDGSVAIAYGADVDSGAAATRVVPASNATIDFSVPGPCEGMFDDSTTDMVAGGELYLTAWDTDGDRTLEIRGAGAGFECPDGPTGFGDVIATSFAYDDIACIFGLGITTGTSPTTYGPGQPVTREQMGAFLARVARLLGVDVPGATHPFGDVSASSFAHDDIALIYQLGVTRGTGDGTTYSPGDHVTREQMAAFLARLYSVLFGTPAAPILAFAADTPFVDLMTTSFAYDDVGRLFGLEITGGTSPTTYSPGDHVTREQMAAFLARLIRILLPA